MKGDNEVSQDVAQSQADAGDVVFAAADYFLGIAQRIITSGGNARVVLPGRGEVSLFPARREFTADIPDWADFFQAPGALFQVTPLDAKDAPQAPLFGRNIGELLWQAGFYASQGRVLESISKYDVVQFRHWPNLPRLPKTANTARICALLTRHPTTIMLVHRMLGINKEEVYRVYSAAYSAGIAHVVSRDRTLDETRVEAVLPEPVQERSLLRSLFAKISGL